MSKFKLSPDQQRVVDHGEGPLVVVAGPGSGKTRVLTERVRRLVTQVPGHFSVLALTFTNKAANEMAERLADLGEVKQRVTISTLHGFCLDILRSRGHFIGIDGELQIFELAKDRKQILLEVALKDPELACAVKEADDQSGGRAKLLDRWLYTISRIKAHPLSELGMDDPMAMSIMSAYNAGLRACGAYDFDDLLLLTYQLLTEFPKIADLYCRIYGYICIDEAQDLNEAQYAVLVALCRDSFRNVVMVGDPKQSIYGFTDAGPKYMKRFHDEFNATIIKLNENFRSSQVVVNTARALNSTYSIDTQSTLRGEIALEIGRDEEDEAAIVCRRLQQLFSTGHPDVENGITPSQCAVLGRNQYVLIAVEQKLKKLGIPCYKRLSTAHEYESSVVQAFHLALRLYANHQDRLHMNELARMWGVDLSCFNLPVDTQGVLVLLHRMSEQNGQPEHQAVVDALDLIQHQAGGLNLSPCIEGLSRFADTMGDPEERRAIRDDAQVLLHEWDQYLRLGIDSTKTIAGFMSSMALGTTRKTSHDGVALLSVHASKGLEFDVVFIVGMVEGVFPDYRARNDPHAMAEEKRSAFVAVTRSKRLLYLTYAQTRKMPWGEIWGSKPSPYLCLMGLA